MKSAFFFFVITVFFGLPSGAANDPLTPLDFLIGKWSGGTPRAAGTDVFQRDLDGHVLQRLSHSLGAAPDGGAQHSMQAQLTVYPVGEHGALAAIYFDNEGHVIHHNRVRVTAGERVEFLSDSREPSPVFRLTYSLKTGVILHVKFEMAPPRQLSYRLIAESDETATH